MGQKKGVMIFLHFFLCTIIDIRCLSLKYIYDIIISYTYIYIHILDSNECVPNTLIDIESMAVQVFLRPCCLSTEYPSSSSSSSSSSGSSSGAGRFSPVLAGDFCRERVELHRPSYLENKGVDAQDAHHLTLGHEQNWESPTTRL